MYDKFMKSKSSHQDQLNFLDLNNWKICPISENVVKTDHCY